MKALKLSELKIGRIFTLKEVEFPNDSQVYIRGEYDRASKSYSCLRYDDINNERFLRSNKTVYVGFTF